MYKIDFAGLACFSARDGRGRIVLLPDGREPDEKIDPHVPRVFVKTEAVEYIDERLKREEMENATVITLPKCRLSFSGTDVRDPRNATLDTSLHDPYVQQLSVLDANFDGRGERRTVAMLRIRRGELLAYRHPGALDEDIDPAIVSQLEVPHDEPITIEVLPEAEREPALIRLKPGTEIVLANTAPRTDGVNTVNHFRLYENLSSKPVNFGGRPPVRAKNLRRLPAENPFFTLSGSIGTSGDCGNTGCCH